MKVAIFCVVCLCKVIAASQLNDNAVNICGTQKEVALESHGEQSSSMVTLDPSVRRSLCRLKVTAPKTHVVNLQFIEEENGTLWNDTSVDWHNNSPCFMSIYLPDNTRAPFWRGDLCSQQALPDVDLLTNDFKIIWTPPENHTLATTRTFLLTAVGSGPVCKEPFQHTCMRIGRIPMLCISDHLLCDGFQNCPKTSTSSDEDKKLCKTARNAWQNLVVEWVKKYRPPVATEEGKWTLKINSSDSATKWLEWELLKKNVTEKPEVIEETHNAAETISAMLNKYGPWGYLMMGLLICGTVLFFCGLWECCCKKPKTEVEPPPLSQPTTVFIMNCQENGGTPSPPNYDDLDLPPSYTTLFPNKEASTSSAEDGSLHEEEIEETNEQQLDDSSSTNSDMPSTS